jgi:hypothetical protein
MVSSAVDLLSTAAAVVLVGLAPIALQSADLVRRELIGRPPTVAHFHNYGIALSVAFVTLVILRFVTLGA